MLPDIFNSLTENVSIGIEHPNYFIYGGDVCQIVCHRFPARREDFAIVSLGCDCDDIPYTDIRLLDVDHEKITMLVEQKITSDKIK